MASARPVRIAIGHNVKGASCAQGAGNWVGVISKAFQRPLHPPFGLGFAGVLTGIQPYLLVACTHGQIVQRLAVQRGPNAFKRDTFAGRRFGHQIVMPIHRIGRKIGKISDVAGRRIGDGQRAIVCVFVKTAVGPRPIFAVF